MNNKSKLIGLGCIIIIAIGLLVALTLPLTDLVVDNNREIALIQINGEISYDHNATDKMSIDNIEAGITDANNNPSVKAIVFEVNSQGGSLVASEEITKLIKSSKKPTVAWISDYGTSEAYLIASGANTIVATPTSVVGGIGLNLKNNKYNNSANSNSMIIQDYKYLIKLIAKNRGVSTSQIATVAESKVYNGNEALNNKLIDKVGDKEDAIIIVASQANLNNFTIVEYPKDPNTQVTSFLNQKMNSKEEVSLELTYSKLKEILNINNLNKLNI